MNSNESTPSRTGRELLAKASECEALPEAEPDMKQVWRDRLRLTVCIRSMDDGCLLCRGILKIGFEDHCIVWRCMSCGYTYWTDIAVLFESDGGGGVEKRSKQGMLF